MSFYDDAKFMFLAGGAAGKDGKLYNIKPRQKIIGEELITNGTFDTDSDWNKVGESTISGGKGNVISTAGVWSNLNQTNVFTVGKHYRVALDVTVNSNDAQSAIKIQDGGTDANIGTVATSGSYEFFYTAEGTTLTIARFSVDSAVDASIDNVSVKEVEGVTADFTFDRGTDLTATRVGKDGYIEKGRKNLLLQSNQFDTTWTDPNADVTSGYAGRDGSNDAWELSLTGTFGQTAQDVSASGISGVNTLSFYAKSGTSDFTRPYIAGPNKYAYFDLLNGQTGVQTGVASSIEDAGNGWWRCSFTVEGTITEVRLHVADSISTIGTTTSGTIYIQDAQLEQGLVATDYIETGSSTATAGLLEDEPRFDYTGGGCPALLIEGNAINLIEHTEYFESWTEGKATVTSNETKSPEGLINASKLLADANGGASANHQIDSDSFTIASGAVSASVYAKKGNTDYVRLRLNSTTAQTRAWFDLENGEVGKVDATDPDAFGTITDMGDGWYRCTVTEPNNTAATTSAALQIFINENDDQTSWVADGDEYIYLYGAQYEQGSYATSYIPNYGAAATASRTYDDPNDLVHGITMGTSCSFFLEATNFKVTETGGAQTSFLQVMDATSPSTADRLLFLGVANTASTFTLQAQNKESGTPATDTLSKTGLTMGSPFKALARYDGTSFDLFVNGVLEDSATIVADDHFGRVGLKNLTSQTQNGHSISQVILFDSALSTNDSEIITGTSYSTFGQMASELSYTEYE